MDSFEKQNAAGGNPVPCERVAPLTFAEDLTDWQPVGRKKEGPPRSSASRPSPARPTHCRPQYGSSASQLSSQKSEECLISFDEPEDRLETWKDPSNAFAALASGDSSSSAASSPRRRAGLPFRLIPVASPNRTTSHQPSSNHRSMQTRHTRTSSSNMDLLMELDPGPFVTSSPGWNNGEDISSDARRVNSSMSLLDEEIPILKRDEDEAWFEAQSNGNRKTPSNHASSNENRRRFVFPPPSSSQAPQHQSYRGRGSPRGRRSPRGRGSPRGRHSHQGPRVNGHDSHSSRPPQSSLPQRARVHGPQSSRGDFQATRGHESHIQAVPSGNTAVPRAHGYKHPPRPHTNGGSFASTSFARGVSNTNQFPSTDSAAMASPTVSKHLEADKVAKAIESEKHIPILAAQHDTSATAEWRRKGMRLGKTFVLPQWNFVGRSLDTKSSSRPVISRVAEIAVTTNTHIIPVWGQHKNISTVRLNIYGDPAAVEAATELIREWLKEIEIETDDKWAKVWAYNRKDERRLRKRLQRDAERQKFRQSIPDTDNDRPQHNVTFIWPLRKEPEKVLGISYEALDPIRMDCICYITCERGPQTVFKLQGGDTTKLQEALDRMHHIPAQWNANAFEAETFVILDVPHGMDDLMPPVSRVPYQLPRPLHENASNSQDDGITFRFKHPARIHYSHAEDTVAMRLLQAVTETTQHARYFQGLLKLHLHLGTFVALKTQSADINQDTYSYPVFADMMEDHENMDARVSAEIGDSIIEGHLLARCFEASHLLAPPDAWTFKLSDIQPIYAATFEIANPVGNAGDLILDVELSHDGGVTNLISKRWLQLRKGKTEPRNLLDGSIVGLQNGLAWHIGLDAFVPVDERALSPNYSTFPHALSLDASNLEAGHSFINYRTKVPIKSVRQKRCWKFNTVASKGEWVVEVSQVMKTVQQNGNQKLFKPRWTLNVHNNNWDRLLATNNSLEIGKAADWGAGNPCNLLFPENPDSSALSGVSRQVGDGTDSESDQDEDSEETQKKADDRPEEPPSLKNFEQLLDLLRQLADVAAGRTNSALH